MCTEQKVMCFLLKCLRAKCWGQISWVRIPIPSLTSFATLNKLPNPSELQFLISKMGIIIAPGQEEKGTTEDEMAGWHHRLDGRESE